MLNITIKATSIELTPAIRDYVEKRLQPLDKFFPNHERAAQVSVEVGKTTNHHNKGEVFRTEINIKAPHANYRAVCEQSDLFASIDDAKEVMLQEVTSHKDKRQTLFRRGALRVKRMMKGITKRNPFTSKYDE